MSLTNFAQAISKSDQAWTMWAEHKNDLRRIADAMEVDENNDQKIIRGALYLVLGEIELRTAPPDEF